MLQDIYEKAKDDNIQSVTQLPYFEGDYWPSVIEDAIKTSENDEGQKRNGKAVEVLNGDVDDELDEVKFYKKNEESFLTTVLLFLYFIVF